MEEKSKTSSLWGRLKSALFKKKTEEVATAAEKTSPETTERTEKTMEKGEKAEKGEKTEKGEKAEKREKAEKGEKAEKTELVPLSRERVEASGVSGHWDETVKEDGETEAAVWVNVEPKGGMMMDVRDGRHGYKEGIVPQPEEAACFSHSPPDQSLASYNQKRAERFDRALTKRFPALVKKKVERRSGFFERLHQDGIKVPRDPNAPKRHRHHNKANTIANRKQSDNVSSTSQPHKALPHK